MSKPSDSIKDWANIRKRVLDRDGWRCRVCGNYDGECKLNAHHIDWNRKHNEQSNLVTLCTECHRQVHAEGYKPELFEDWPVPWGAHPTD